MPATPRERILDTAIQLFSRIGVNVVGVDRIVTEANVAPMTLYRHFDSKDELIAAALEQWSAQWLQWLHDEIEGRGVDPTARFNGLLDALQESLASQEHGGALVTSAATEIRGEPNHPARKVITEHRAELRQVLEGLAKQVGVNDPARLAGQLQIIIDGFVVGTLIDRHRPITSLRALANAALSLGTEE